MSCNICVNACPIHPCYDNLWIGRINPHESYTVKITDLGSKRQVAEVVSSNASGLIKLTDGTWNDFLNSGSEFKLEVFMNDFSVSPSTTSNIPMDFYAITGFDGAYYNIEPEFAANAVDCILFSTEMLYNSSGVPITLDNQYLINE